MSAFADAARQELSRARRIERATGNAIASSNIRETVAALTAGYVADMDLLKAQIEEEQK